MHAGFGAIPLTADKGLGRVLIIEIRFIE